MNYSEGLKNAVKAEKDRILSFIENPEIYLVIRTDRMGEDAIELAFKHFEDAKKYAAFENDRPNRYADEVFLVRAFKLQ